MIIDAGGINGDNLLILIDGELEDLLRLRARLQVTERAQIDSAQQAMSIQVLGIMLENVLGFEDGVANASGLGIEFGQAGVEIRRLGIVGDGQLVLFIGLVGVFGARVAGDLFLVNVGQ